MDQLEFIYLTLLALMYKRTSVFILTTCIVTIICMNNNNNYSIKQIDIKCFNVYVAILIDLTMSCLMAKPVFGLYRHSVRNL